MDLLSTGGPPLSHERVHSHICRYVDKCDYGDREDLAKGSRARCMRRSEIVNQIQSIQRIVKGPHTVDHEHKSEYDQPRVNSIRCSLTGVETRADLERWQNRMNRVLCTDWMEHRYRFFSLFVVERVEQE